MEAAEDLWSMEALHESDLEMIAEAEQVDLKKAFAPLPNDERLRRERMADNFHEQLQELIEEYYEGAQTFGEFHAPAIVQGLEKVLQQATFRNVVDDISYVGEDEGGVPEVYNAGMVEVKVDGDEVSISHGHGENLFLSRDEFEDFANMITQNRLKGGM